MRGSTSCSVSLDVGARDCSSQIGTISLSTFFGTNNTSRATKIKNRTFAPSFFLSSSFRSFDTPVSIPLLFDKLYKGVWVTGSNADVIELGLLKLRTRYSTDGKTKIDRFRLSFGGRDDISHGVLSGFSWLDSWSSIIKLIRIQTKVNFRVRL